MQMTCPWNCVLTSEFPIFVPLGFTFPKVWKCSLMRRNRQTHQCWNDFLGKTIIFYDLAVVTSHKVSNWRNWYKNLHKRSFCFIRKMQPFSISFFFVCFVLQMKRANNFYIWPMQPQHPLLTYVITNNFNSEDFIMWPKRFLFPILQEGNFPLKSFDRLKTFHVIVARIKKLV